MATTSALALLAALAGAALFGGLWYVEKRALEKLAAISDRAGVDIRVGSILIEPGARVELRDVEVSDTDDDINLLRVQRVVLDLTFEDLVAGRRRPQRVVLIGLEADARDPDRWRKVVDRYRGPKTAPRPASEPPAILPTVAFDNATILIEDPLSGAPLRLENVAAQILPRAAPGQRWHLTAAADLEGLTHIVVAAFLDPARGEHELGATFTPALTVHMPAGPRVTVGSVHAVRGGDIRVGDVRVELGPERWLTAEHIEVTRADSAPFPAGKLEAVVRGLDATMDGARVQASALRAFLRSGGVADPLARLERVTLQQMELEVERALIALAAGEVSIDVEGVDPDRPLAGLREVTLRHTDISMALPPADQARAIPYYHQIQAFLLGPPQDLRGGGPAPPQTPTAAAGPDLGLLHGARPTLRLEDGTLALLVGSSPEPALLLEALDASLLPGEDGRAVTATASGKLRELATGEQGTFAVEARTRADGALEHARIRLSGSKLTHYIARLSDKIRLTDKSSLSVDLTVTPHATDRGFSAAGSVAVQDMGFFAPRIHGTPVDGVDIAADVTVDLSPEQDKLVIDAPRITLADSLVVRFGATIEHLDNRLPKLDVRIAIPEQPCNRLIASIPPVMVPRLNGLVLEGSGSAHLDFTVDLEDPRGYQHDVAVDLTGCRPAQYGVADVGRLQRAFVHDVVEKGEPIGVTVGPGTWHFRSLRRIPKHVQMGALYTEDHSFFRHGGFRVPLIRRAVIMNLEGGRYIYGGSTITQQLVKNLFLSREKTITRKLEEAILVWLVERALPKSRILELYLNCIEYGPRIYGIENAARAYFGKHVEELDALEGAFLMGLKPYPWAGWQQYQRGYVKPWWHRRLSKILEGMAKRGWITNAQLENARAMGWEPVFLTSAHTRRMAAPAPVPTPPQRDDDEPPPATPNAPIFID